MSGVVVVGFVRRGLLHFHAQWFRDLFANGLMRLLLVEYKLAPEIELRVDVAENDVGVGYSWFGSTAIKSDRPRHLSRALRTDLQSLIQKPVEPGD